MKYENVRSKLMVVYLMIALAVSMVTVFFLPHLREEVNEVWEILHERAPYDEFYRPTENLGEGKNEAIGVVLHHTAVDDIDLALRVLTQKRRSNNVSCHLLVDFDGTRYVLASPTDITWHAGPSSLNGREGANDFTIGIEFQGNTVEKPLTYQQIESAIDYLIPILKEYNIPLDNIVTHEQVRDEYRRLNPKKKAAKKVDVTPEEHARFMKILKGRLALQENEKDNHQQH